MTTFQSVPPNRFALRKSAQRMGGFTLIELMITVAVVAILARIAYPAYTQYFVRVNRSAAESFLLSVANRQEQYNLDARQYAADPGGLATLGITAVPSEVSSSYTIAVTSNNAATPPSYSITATPTGLQLSRDTKCGTLSIDQQGNKGRTGTGTVAECWKG